MNARVKIALAASLLLLLLVLGIRWQRAHTPQGLVLDLSPNLSNRYELNYEVQGQTWMDARSAQALAQPQSSQIKVSGQLHLQVEGREADGSFSIAFHFEPSAWIFAIPGLAPSGAKTEAFQGRYLLSSRGEVLEFWLETGREDELSPWVADLLSLISFQLPNGEAESWSTDEQSFQSMASVIWSLGEVEGSRIGLERNYARSPKGTLQVDGQGKVFVSLSEYIQSIAITRSRSFGQSSQDRTRLDLKLLGPAEAFAPKPISELLSENLRGTAYAARQNLATARGILGTSSVAELQEALEAADQERLQSSMPTYQKLKALFLLYPERMQDFRRFVLDFPYSDVRCAHVLTALTTVGSKEAQAFLRELYQELGDDPAKRKQLIPHLSHVAEPDVQTESLLQQAAEDTDSDIRTTANLGLGTVAHQLRSLAPQRSRDILKKQSQRLESGEEREQLNALRAIGNIGLPEQLEIVKPYLSAPNPEVQRLAINALRHVDHPESYQLLLGIIENNPDEASRLMATESLRYGQLDESIVSLLAQRLYKESSIPVLKQTASLLSLYWQPSASARDTLLRFQKECGHPELCPYVDALLTSLQDPSKR
jgi:hypothetical protein